MEDIEEIASDSYESSDDYYNNVDYDEEQYIHRRSKTYPCVAIKPYIRANVPQLIHIASAVVAVSLWKHLNIPRILFSTEIEDHCIKETSHWIGLRNVVLKMASDLPVPRSVIEQINQMIHKIHREIGNWSTYHFRAVFINSIKDETMYSHVHELIWRSDGSIDCIETAKNMSKSISPRLNDIEKYRFLCTYCLKDEIQQISPVILSDIIQDYVRFDRHPLIRYWNCYLSDKLHSIPTHGYESLDCCMFQHRFVDNWPAKEYFFDRLSPEEQVRNAIWLIDNKGVLYQKALLTKLNESQRISVYMARCQEIIINYITRKGKSKDVLRTWFDVRHLITEEQFVKIFDSLLEADGVGKVLSRIWYSAEGHLKLHLLNYNNYEYIEKILASYRRTLDHNFVFTVFRDFDKRMKNHILIRKESILLNFCEALFSRFSNLLLLDRLSKLLLSKRKTINLLKGHIVFLSDSIQKHCLEYYSNADVKGLNDLLTYHLLAECPDDVLLYKKQLLMSWQGISKCTHLLDPETDNLSKLIIDAFGTDADLQKEFIKKLFDSYMTEERFRDLLAHNDLNNLNKIIDRYLTSNEDKENLKKKLLDKQDRLMAYIFVKYDKSYLETVLRWRLSQEKGTMKEWTAIIQEIISINGMFDQILYENVTGRLNHKRGGHALFGGGVRRDFNSSCFDSLNRFLNWCFESSSDVKRYKLSRIHSYANVFVIAELLEYERCCEEAIKVIIRWFLDDDGEEIEKFKKMCKKDIKMRGIMNEIDLDFARR